MAVVESLLGHLLSQYDETVTEGIRKIITNTESVASFADTFIAHRQAAESLLLLLERKGFKGTSLVHDACATLLRKSGANARTALARILCSQQHLRALRRQLDALSEDTLHQCVSALGLFSELMHALPKLLFTKLGKEVPLSLAVFRGNIPFGLRRIRLARTRCLLAFVSTRFAEITSAVVVSHGFLTQLLEDVTDLYSTEAEGPDTVHAILQKLQDHFVESRVIDAHKKREVLLGQRNILKTLVRGLSVEPLAERVKQLLFRLVAELKEAPSDYTLARHETDDHGMTNFIVFTLLRLLKPKQRSVDSQIAVFIAHQTPDLIRPYFTRVSQHLTDEDRSVSKPAAIAAVVNVMTRTFMAPLPSHLSVGVAQLLRVDESPTTFFTLTARNCAEEVCPAWFDVFIHKMVNGSRNLMLLVWAMQATQAALTRALHVKRLITSLLDSSRAGGSSSPASDGNHDGAAGGKHHVRSGVDVDLFFNAFEGALAEHLPKREEFTHRITQQLHQLLNSSSSASGDQGSEDGDAQKKKEMIASERVQFVYQRMLLLLDSYTELFNIRSSWLSTVPPAPTMTGASLTEIVTKRLGPNHMGNWEPASLSVVCRLLLGNMRRSTPLAKLHHVTMGSSVHRVTDMPPLLSILVWLHHHREAATTDPDVALASQWVLKLVLWCIHSVSIKFGATDVEVWAWMNALKPATLPLFLHLLNSMQQQSLSKAADRIAHTLLEGKAGMLVEAAKNFIQRHEDKKKEKQDAQSQQEVPAEASTANKSKKKGGNKKEQKSSAPKEDLWQIDISANLMLFKMTVDAIETKLSSSVGRKEVAKGLAAVQALARGRAAETARGRHVLHQAVVVKAATHSTLLPLHQQLLDVVNHQRVPTVADPSSPRDQAFVERHSATAGATSNGSAPRDAKALYELLCGGEGTDDDDDTLGGCSWLYSPHAAWMAASSLFHRAPRAPFTGTASSAGDNNDDEAKDSQLALQRQQMKYLKKIAVHVFAHIKSEKKAFVAAFEEMSATHRLAVACVLLRVTQLSFALWRTTAATADGDNDGSSSKHPLSKVKALRCDDEADEDEDGGEEGYEGDVDGGVLVAIYEGTTSCTCRCVYSAMLLLHYMDHPAETLQQQRAPTAAASSKSVTTTAAGKRLQRQQNGGNSSGRVSKKLRTEQEEEQEAREEENDAPEDEEPSLILSDNDDDDVDGGISSGDDDDDDGDDGAKKQPTAARGRRRGGGAVFVTSQVDCLIRARYVINGLPLTSATTPEVEALAQVVDGWTEEDALRTAQQCPMNLSNAVSAAADSRPSAFLRLVFPEAPTPRDRATVMLRDLCGGSVGGGSSGGVDPRYLAPLLTIVGAVRAQEDPRLAPPHLLTKAFSFCLRGLAFPDSGLRFMCETALGLMSTSLSPVQRAIVNFARLRMLHASTHAKSSRRKVARLDTPVASFLVLAGPRVLSRASHPLLHDILKALHDQSTVLNAACPLSWLAHAFPTAAITTSIMLKGQEELRRKTAGRSITGASAQEVQTSLKVGKPPHLDFILEQLASSCATPDDVRRVIQSGALADLLGLVGMITSAAHIREQILECVECVARSSADAAYLTATQGNVVPWALLFIERLPTDPATLTGAPGEERVVCRILRLLMVLYPQYHVHQLQHAQVLQRLRGLRSVLAGLRVSAVDIVTLVDELVGVVERAAAFAAAAEKRKKVF